METPIPPPVVGPLLFVRLAVASWRVLGRASTRGHTRMCTGIATSPFLAHPSVGPLLVGRGTSQRLLA